MHSISIPMAFFRSYPNQSLLTTQLHGLELKSPLATRSNKHPSRKIHMSLRSRYKDVSKSSRRILVKRSFLTLDVKFLHHLQSTPLSHEYSGPSVSAMLGSIPGSLFLELCQVPAAIPLESLQWCRIFDPSSDASA